MARRLGDNDSQPDFELAERIKKYRKKIIREYQRDSHSGDVGDRGKEIKTDGGRTIKIPTLANFGLITLGIGSFGLGLYLVTRGDTVNGSALIVAGLTSLLTGLRNIPIKVEIKLELLKEIE